MRTRLADDADEFRVDLGSAGVVDPSRSHTESGHDNIVGPPASSTSGSSSQPKVSTPSSTPFARTEVIALIVVPSHRLGSPRLLTRDPPETHRHRLRAAYACGSPYETAKTVDTTNHSSAVSTPRAPSDNNLPGRSWPSAVPPTRRERRLQRVCAGQSFTQTNDSR